MQRMRRLRVNENMRSLVRETSVEISDLVYPIFVEEGENIAEYFQAAGGNRRSHPHGANRRNPPERQPRSPPSG